MNKHDNSFSQAETYFLVEPMHAILCGHVRGGELMRLMEDAAGSAAAKHAKERCDRTRKRVGIPEYRFDWRYRVVHRTMV